MAALQAPSTPAVPPRRSTHHADMKTADPEVALDVALISLDYFLHHAIKDILDELEHRKLASSDPKGAKDRTRRTDNHISLVDSYVQIFRAQHPGVQPPRESIYRLQLVRFVTLYARRVLVDFSATSMFPKPDIIYCSPDSAAKLPMKAVKELRHKNRARAQQWLEFRGQDSQTNQTDRFTLSTDELLDSAQACDDVSLLDLVPAFVSLGRAFQDLRKGRVASQGWLRLAAEMMLQASAEQAALNEHLYGDARLHDTITEAFAWGPLADQPLSAPLSPEGSPRSDEAINTLSSTQEVFYAEPQAPEQDSNTATPATASSDGIELSAEPWRAIRRQAIDSLKPALPSKKRSLDGEPCNNTAVVLSSLLRSEEHSQGAFDKKMREFVQGGLDNLELPIMLQIEAALGRGETAETAHLTVDGRRVPVDSARVMMECFTSLHI